MKRSRITNLAKTIGLILSVAVFASCAGNDYVNAIPDDSVMLMSINPTRLTGAKSPLILKTLLNISNIDDIGLDLSENVYFFEDARGNIGICAKVANSKDLNNTISKRHIKITQKHDCHFAALPSGWMLGFSDNAALLMGPIVVAQQAEYIRIMSNYLNATEEDGIKGTAMFDKLDSIEAPMAMVTQANALPEKFIAPFTIGAPKGTDPADIVLAAEMEVRKGKLLVQGHTFSFKKSINKALEEANGIYRPIEGKYMKTMSEDDAIGMFINVDGQRFHSLITQNRAITAMLAGINSAIDMDNILRSVDGDLALVSSSLGSETLQLTMAAKLKDAVWLNDIDYWKQSVPAGGKIGDWGKNCYYYTSGKTSYYFGVSADMQYMSGGSERDALNSINASPNPIGTDLQQMIAGQRLVMLINFASLKGDKVAAVTSLLKPMFGNVDTIVYTLK